MQTDHNALCEEHVSSVLHIVRIFVLKISLD